MNKTFRFNNSIDFKIVGVLKDIPDNTNFLVLKFIFHILRLGSIVNGTGRKTRGGEFQPRSNPLCVCSQVSPPQKLKPVLPAYVKKYRAESKNVHHYKLQRLEDVHFNPQYQGVMSKTNLGVLALIGVFLIITAALNFINLATAQAVNRSKEIGVRKALGSARVQLFWQLAIRNECDCGFVECTGILYSLCGTSICQYVV